MNEQINIWLVGNTGLRNPNRIQEGFSVFANSAFVGRLHGRENELGFMNLLDEKGIIQNEEGKDSSGSHARKWRLMFAKNGLIYPQIQKKNGRQEALGTLDDITPFGRSFLKADTYPAVQECYLRAMSVEQFPMPDGTHYFSPLRWLLAIMLEIEKRTGSSELSRIEFALWGHTTNPGYNLEEVVDNILDLRQRRAASPAKRLFDKEEIAKRGRNYGKKANNFLDYSDMNMRYLRISGVLQRKGRGLIIVPTKHVLAERLAKSTASSEPIMEQYKLLCTGAPLPTDNVEVAEALLDDLIKQMKERHILYDISDLPLNTPAEINIARQRLENILAQTDEIRYASDQCNQWKEIRDYMTLLIKGGGKLVYDEDNAIEVPKDETPAYLEWTLWRAALAIGHMVNKPYEVRGFKLDSDFLPVSAAGGGKGDLYCEFRDFTILTEVTMSTSSRQEAMEGEPVRRHVSDAVLKYDKPVYGMFIAIRIDTNTAETFRHGIWYAKGDMKQRLDILPLTLGQFQKYFIAMFEANKANPEKLRELIVKCESRRDILEAPAWKQYIDAAVSEKASEIAGDKIMTDKVFDELREVDEYSWKWQSRQKIDFCGKMCEVDLLVQGNRQNEITERQKEAFCCFMEKWTELQGLLVDALIEYYNEEEKFSYGPEDEEEAGEWWPEIETEDALLKAVTLESVVVAEDFMMDEGRRIYLLFSRIWGGEDLEDNGIGVCFINETIDEIAYKDIAF